MDIANKVIIVTGASMGIGESLARLLHERGARVVLAARSREKLAALAKELPGSLAIETDMREGRAVAALIDEAHQHFGRIDALVNNAAQGLYGEVERLDPEAFLSVWRLNVEGPLIAMQHAIARMRAEGGGTIVNISSMVSKNYIPRLGGYAATKYALNCLSLTARQELERDNIIVSVVYPGLTDTEFGQNAVRSDNSMVSRNRDGMPGADSPEFVAERILYALESGEPEVYMR